MRIGIVNDLKLAVEVLRRAVAMIPDASVAWIAEDGAAAVARCAADRPDLVLMDMVMPVMDGVEATRRIMAATPCPILVVTATVEGNSGKVFEALGAGALDAVATPGLAPDGSVINAEALYRKVRSIQLIIGVSAPRAVSTFAPQHTHHAAAMTRPILAIGASTGGPLALSVILRSLPRPVPWPVVVVQHVDPGFAAGLASWLASETGQVVSPVTPGDPPMPERILIAATGDHLVIDSGGRLRYSAEPRDMVYRPSVDVFFDSLRTSAAPPGIAVVLTGMGRDGASGMAGLRAAGWHTIAQDRATSVVWGMPGACVELGAARETLPIGEIGPALALRITSPQRSTPMKDTPPQNGANS